MMMEVILVEDGASGGAAAAATAAAAGAAVGGVADRDWMPLGEALSQLLGSADPAVQARRVHRIAVLSVLLGVAAAVIGYLKTLK
jgi:hypothetical protein